MIAGLADHPGAALTRFVSTLCLCALAGWSVTLIDSTQSFWLVILWLGWGAAAIWTFTRPSFSIPFAIILAGMLIYVAIPATIHVVENRTVIAGDDFGAGTTRALQISAIAQWATFAGALLARAIRPARPLTPIHMTLSAERLDRAAIIALGVGYFGLLLDVVSGHANIHQFFFFSSQTGYGSFYQSAASSGVF